MNTELKQQLIAAGYQGVNGRMDFLLEELIEACEPTKEDFALFCYPPSTWVAEYKNPHRSVSLGEATGEFRGEGSTPTEAVARLWLALHTKLTDTK